MTIHTDEGAPATYAALVSKVNRTFPEKHLFITVAKSVLTANPVTEGEASTYDPTEVAEYLRGSLPSRRAVYHENFFEVPALPLIRLHKVASF